MGGGTGGYRKEIENTLTMEREGKMELGPSDCLVSPFLFFILMSLVSSVQVLLNIIIFGDVGIRSRKINH